MDPNANVAELRELTATMLWDVATDRTDTETRFAELFDALDTWLSRGGFLPTVWQR